MEAEAASGSAGVLTTGESQRASGAARPDRSMGAADAWARSHAPSEAALADVAQFIVESRQEAAVRLGTLGEAAAVRLVR